jgi:acetyl-CoA C-acetyltransferase
MSSSYLISGCRTPIGKFLGSFANVPATDLGGAVIREAISRSGIEAHEVEQVIMGQVIQAGVGQAPARQAAIAGGLPASVGAVTVNKVCGSGLYSVMLADMAIRAGEYRYVIAGGMENMSLAPHLLRNGRSGWKFGDQCISDAIDVDGLRCANLGVAMGCIGEWQAMQASVSRHDQDAWAVQSHARAVAAQDQSLFDDELVPIRVPSPRGEAIIHADETPRRDCTLEAIAKLKPAFWSRLVTTESNDYEASVTPGNASSLSDGAAAVMVVGESQYRDLPSCDWAYRILGHCTYAQEHLHLFTAPVGAIRKLFVKTGLGPSDVDLYEINEAFAAQTITCLRELELPADKVNIHGGAIALGHPLGCSGTRILVSLLSQLRQRGLRRGIACLCLGGGEAVAMMVERIA